MGGTHVYLWLIHVDIWQKSSQYCKVIIFLIKINYLKKLKEAENRMVVARGCGEGKWEVTNQ